MSPSRTFVAKIIRAVAARDGDIDADVDRLVAAWERILDGREVHRLTGVLRTYDGLPLPRASEDLIAELPTVFGTRDAMSARELADVLGMSTKRLAKLLEPAGLGPLNVKVDGGTRKGYRRGWFAGYFEQLDAAYAAPVCEVESALLKGFKDSFGAVEVPAESVCRKPCHAGKEWRLAAGGRRQCAACHPPVDGLGVEWAVAAAEVAES